MRSTFAAWPASCHGADYGIFASFGGSFSWYGRLDFIEGDLNNYLCIDINCHYY